MDLWNCDKPITDFDIDVPAWIDQGITPYDVAAIIQGGCDSGAYMPAVTYSRALQTMNDHGDAIFQYLEDNDALSAPDPLESWAHLATHLVSCAVELWASSIESELEALED